MNSRISGWLVAYAFFAEAAGTQPAQSEASQPAQSEASQPAQSEASQPAQSEASQPAQSEASRPAKPDAAWNAKAAAAYLDQRMTWWAGWSTSQRDHETFCVSCHTSGPYAVARPSLDRALSEPPSAIEQRMLDNVTRRVRLWKEVAPFYPTKVETDPKAVESRGTESIFNALILTRRDEPSGKLSADSRAALDNIWSEQIKSGTAAGAWPWLQFHNSPFEGDSQFYGASLAAVAIGSAPPDYRESAAARAGIAGLSGYLGREQASQILIDRVTLLWASAKLPGLLSPGLQRSIAEAAYAKQQPDGGFSLSSCVGNWKRHDNTPLDSRSDGYATGLIAFALEQTGSGASEPHLRRALNWLAANQQPAGNWEAWSLNKQRDPSTDAAKFMGDAATAYAAMALAAAK